MSAPTGTDASALKRDAARAALAEVSHGMRLGLGTGSTATAFVELLGEAVAGGLDVICVPTSERIGALAKSLHIPLSTLEETPKLDLAIDGADEIGPGLSLIKGGGGALLREKIVATAAKRFVVIADAGKVVEALGTFPLPIEIVPFGQKPTTRKIVAAAQALEISGRLTMRRDEAGELYVTDGGHHIVDAFLTRIPNPAALGEALDGIPGVVEHGLFVGIAKTAYVAGPDGIRRIDA
ncbi:ribose-5-phosphate isomerase RpiA [Pseudoxanthobacter sp. M-2]|uniref:ribose-5-phosphate isomerase RpiA n=1 Tax=Pseudoxanthobacter sp. M-2 TaxID=3078754 RepID=UPI0038FC098C